MNEQPISSNEILNSFAAYDEKAVDLELINALKNSRHKIVVLDDDPTGVQTVHGVHVYTDWSISSINKALKKKIQYFHSYKFQRLYRGRNHQGSSGNRFEYSCRS